MEHNEDNYKRQVKSKQNKNQTIQQTKNPAEISYILLATHPQKKK